MGVFDRKKIILSPKLVKNTTEKGQNQENQDRPSSEPILLYKLPLVALSSSHMYQKMMVMGYRMGFLTKLPKNDPRITPKQKKRWYGPTGKVRPSKVQVWPSKAQKDTIKRSKGKIRPSIVRSKKRPGKVQIRPSMDQIRPSMDQIRPSMAQIRPSKAQKGPVRPGKDQIRPSKTK